MNIRTDNTFSGSYLYISGDARQATEEKFDITGMVSLANEYAQKDMTYDVILEFIKELSNMGKMLEQDNRNVEGLFLNPDYIYINKSVFNMNLIKIKFIYSHNNIGTDFKYSIRALAEFIIEHADHKDDRTINLAYGFYMQVRNDNYMFDDLVKC